MNTSVLTNLFTANIGIGANPANIANSPKTNKFAPAQKNNEFKTDDTQSPATDNIYDVAQKTSPDEPENDFSEAMTQAAAAHKTSEAQNPEEAEEKAHIYGVATELTPEQLELTKYLLTTTAAKANGEATQKTLVKPKNAENSVKTADIPEQSNGTTNTTESNQSENKPSEIIDGNTDTAEGTQAENKPSEIIDGNSNTDTAEGRQAENKPSITIDREHLGQENISLGDDDADKTIEIKPGQGQDTANIQTSVEVPSGIKITVTQPENQQTTPQESVDDAQTPSPEANPIPADQQPTSDQASTPDQQPATEQKPAPVQANNTTPLPTVNTGKAVPVSVKPAELEKLDSFEVPKAPPANENTPAAENKASNQQQDVPTALEEKVSADSEPENNVTAGKQNEVLQQVLADTPKNQQSASVIDNLLKDLNPQQTKVVPEVTTSQAKTDTDTTTEDNSNTTNFAQVFSQSNPQQAITEPTAVVTEKAAAPASVSEQIQETITASLKDDSQQITIQLDPPELGKVTIKFQQQDGQITGELQVDKMQTRYEIEQALPQITKNLQDAGIQIKRIEVVLNNQPEQQSFKEQTAYDGNTGQQDAQNSGANQGTFTGNWSPDILSNSYYDLSDAEQMLITDDAINMLV